MKIYFFDIEHSQLIGQLSDEERTDIVSKFFKLDKIQTFNETASEILEEQKKFSKGWEEEVEKGESSLKYILDKISLISLPKLPKDELIRQKINGDEQQRQASEWSKYVVENAARQARLTVLTDTYKEKTVERAGCRTIQEIDDEIEVIRQEINKINTVEIPELKIITREAKSLERDIAKKRAEGNEKYKKFMNLHEVQVCPTCGKPLDTPLDIESTKAELQAQVEILMKEVADLQQELDLKRAEEADVPFKMTALTAKLRDLEITINTLEKEKSKISDLDSEIFILDRNLRTLNNTINSTPIPPQVELPDGFLDRMSEIRQGISSWELWENFDADRQSVEGAIATAQHNLQIARDNVKGLEQYVKLTGSKGDIWKEIMEKMADQFSDNQVKYEVDVYTKNRKDHLDLVSFYNNKGNWVSYTACSSGQKTILDIHFLSKIVTRMGLLVMDEFLKHLDPTNHDVCIDIISQCNVGCILLSSHMETVSNFNNKTCSLSLNENGSTVITLK